MAAALACRVLIGGIGGIGVCGGSAEEDAICARAALAALGFDT